MFYDIFKQLCDSRGISPTKASQEIGFSKGSVSYWKKLYNAGKDAKPDSYTTEKIANFFGVSIDYLLGRTTDPIDYNSDGDALAEIPLTYVTAADGDMKKAREFMLIVENDAKTENENRSKAVATFMQKFSRLDDVDRAKVEAYTDGLLSADKYQIVKQTKDA